MNTGPTLEIEKEILSISKGKICGIDEVGRGALAGPVISAAVILDIDNVPSNIKDSKKLNQKERELKFSEIIFSALDIGIGSSDNREIDDINILQATLLSMKRAYLKLSVHPKVALIDGNKSPDIKCKTKTIINGDNKSLSIAAASIIAKVHRDKLMREIHKKLPSYNFNNNVGYEIDYEITKLRADGYVFWEIDEFLNNSDFDFPLNKY